MSRHRNVRNLDEDDYYDDDDDGYYDEDEYYLEQQREKERKAKLEAAKKARANQAKQLKSKAATANTTATANANAAQKTRPVASNKGKNNNVDSDEKVGAAAGISVVSAHLSHAPKSIAAITDDEAPPPRLPDQILARLQSSLSSNSSTSKQHLSLVILGHVDAGKSTLTGRLLLTLRHVSPRLLAKYRKESTTVGKPSFALAWFTDEDETERERGVTVDVGTKFMKTDRYEFTVLDAPGHRDFVPSMISGTASADCGLLVVAASTGEFEAGFAVGGASSGIGHTATGGSSNNSSGSAGGGQTREHIVLARGLGVTQILVAVNKLDAADPPWDESRFRHIKSNVLAFLTENGFKPHRIQFVPVSGLTGVNVGTTSINNNNQNNSKNQDDAAAEDGWKTLRQWYKGPTLIEALNSFAPVKRDFEKTLRYIVSDVSSEGKAVTVRGRIVQGFLKLGDTVAILPLGDQVNVTRLEKGKATNAGDSPYSFANNANSTEGSNESRNNNNDNNGGNDRNEEFDNYAFAGDTVECSFTGIDAARVSPGCVVSHPQLSVRPCKAKKFEARIMLMERLAVPIIRGSQVLFHMHSIDVPAVLSRLVSAKKRGENTPRDNPRVLSGGVEAAVEITLSEYLVLEEYSDCKSLGRFVLRRGGETVAIGLIEKLIRRK